MLRVFETIFIAIKGFYNYFTLSIPVNITRTEQFSPCSNCIGLSSTNLLVFVRICYSV